MVNLLFGISGIVLFLLSFLSIAVAVGMASERPLIGGLTFLAIGIWSLWMADGVKKDLGVRRERMKKQAMRGEVDAFISQLRQDHADSPITSAPQLVMAQQRQDFMPSQPSALDDPDEWL